jgi:hypothetical protein
MSSIQDARKALIARIVDGDGDAPDVQRRSALVLVRVPLYRDRAQTKTRSSPRMPPPALREQGVRSVDGLSLYLRAAVSDAG